MSARARDSAPAGRHARARVHTAPWSHWRARAHAEQRGAHRSELLAARHEGEREGGREGGREHDGSWRWYPIRTSARSKIGLKSRQTMTTTASRSKWIHRGFIVCHNVAPNVVARASPRVGVQI